MTECTRRRDDSTEDDSIEDDSIEDGKGDSRTNLLAGSTSMFTRSKVAIFAAFVLAAAPQALAKDASIPNIDLKKLCRATAGAMSDIYGTATANDFESCMSDEKSAREQLVKDWATFSASDKGLCVQPTDYLPSYVEWLTCAELQRDARKMRNDQRASTPQTPSTRRQSPG